MSEIFSRLMSETLKNIQYKSWKFFFNLKILHSFIICNYLQDMKHVLIKFENLIITTQVFLLLLWLCKSWMLHNFCTNHGFLYYFLQMIYGNNFHWCNFSFHNIPQIFYHTEIWLVRWPLWELKTIFFYICKQHEISTLQYKNNAISYLNE